MKPLKIVVSGPVGAGKSTFIHTLAGEAFLETDEEATEAIGKLRTTVALDFACLRVGDKSVLLFGTPGQARFDYMWEVLCEGARGLILLVAGDRPQEFAQARHILTTLRRDSPLPYAVGVTRHDLAGVSLTQIAAALEVPRERLVGLDAREAETAHRALVRLLEIMALKTVPLAG